MFKWIKPKNPAASASPPQQKAASAKSKDDLIREAMGNAKIAREAIGEETLSRVRDIMQKQQQAKMKSVAQVARAREVSPMEQAKKILLSMEPEKLADHLRSLREHDKTTLN